MSTAKIVGKLVYATVMTAVRCGFALGSRVVPQQAAIKAEALFTTPQGTRSRQFRDLPPPQQTSIPSAYGELCCYEWPGSGAKRALLVHGWSGSPVQFRALIATLLKQGYGVVCYDQPAHGRSHGKRASLPDFMTGLHAVFSHYPYFDLALAHSLGGTALARFLADSTGTSPVGKVVLAAAPADIEDVTRRFAAMLWLTEPVRGRMQQQIEQRYAQPMTEFAAGKYAKRIKVPVMIAHDKYDREVPFQDAAILHRAIEQSHLLEVDAGGHQKFLKQEQFLDSVMTFANSTAGRSGQ
jgi:pimeloyl-ACP methyl ester carboxylesterase